MVNVRFRKVMMAFCLLFISPWVRAEQSQKDDGVNEPETEAFLSIGLGFGQAFPAEDSVPGIFGVVSVEPGIVSPLGHWNRMELSAELSTGGFSFKRKDRDVNATYIQTVGSLVKFGYGYSVGHNAVGVMRVGLGPLMGKYSEKQDGELIAEETLTGFGGLLGIDTVFSFSDHLDIVAGVGLRYGSFYGDETESFQVNIPSLSLASRFVF